MNFYPGPTSEATEPAPEDKGTSLHRPITVGELQTGLILVVTRDTGCMKAGDRKIVNYDATGDDGCIPFYVSCGDGCHFLTATNRAGDIITDAKKVDAIVHGFGLALDQGD